MAEVLGDRLPHRAGDEARSKRVFLILNCFLIGSGLSWNVDEGDEGDEGDQGDEGGEGDESGLFFL